MIGKRFDVVALGELLVDFTDNGLSEQGNTLFEANPGGALCCPLTLTSVPLCGTAWRRPGRRSNTAWPAAIS